MDYLHLLRKVFKGLGEPITTCVHAIITYIYAYMCMRAYMVANQNMCLCA